MKQLDTRPVIVLGAGGHAKVVADSLLCLGLDIKGFVTPGLVAGGEYNGYKVLGDDNVVFDYDPGDIILANGVGALPKQEMRWKLGKQMRQKGYAFITFIHPSAVVADDVVLSDGVQIMAGAIIQPGVRIGQDSIINTGAILDHDCLIESNCHVAPGVACGGSVRVGKLSHLGIGTSVVQNISIGENSIIAAGSMVYKDLPANSTFIQARMRKSY